MKHSNISIFIPHIGCPNKCSFCNQHTISGAQKAPTAQEVRDICKKALMESKAPENTEIAFFGGSFTAIPREYMLQLLEAVQDFIGEGKFSGIRISTRPDCIDGEILTLLKGYGVTAIELGAQSMKNSVLRANDRGHTVEDVYRASELIKEFGFELGLQIMPGLYTSRSNDDLKTMYRVISIFPDTVRIYPVVILEGTKLAELYKEEKYKLISFEEMVELCGRMLIEFESSGIRVIRCGLHASDNIDGEKIGGYYHPAFKELCESYIYRTAMEKTLLEFRHSKSVIYNICHLFRQCEFAVTPSCISKALGHKKSNAEYFKQRGIDIKIIGDEKIPKYQCELRR